MWTSIIGLGISAAAFGFRGNKNRSTDNSRARSSSIQTIMKKIQTNGNFKPENMAAFAEFAKEIIPEAGKMNKNNNTIIKNSSEINPAEDSIKTSKY